MRRLAQVAALVLSFVIVGCGGVPVQEVLRPDEPRGVQGMNYRFVTCFFATDRKVLSQAASIGERFSDDRGPLALGTVQVSIPPGHKSGEIERPKWYRLEFRENPEKHMVLLAAELMDPDAYFAKMNGLLEGQPVRSAFIFVHGYNVSFESAALRTAQMAADLRIGSVPMFYSWPSQGNLARYMADENNIEWTEPHLRSFLEQVADRAADTQFYIVAHSMGSRATTRALVGLLEARQDLRPRFHELVLAAPDIDAEVFKEQLAPRLLAMNQAVTLYASSNDKALAVSRDVHGEPRAGESGESLVVVSGVETIDASSIDTDFLGHSYFVTERTLLTDITLLLKDRMRATMRPMLEPQETGDGKYWRFRP